VWCPCTLDAVATVRIRAKASAILRMVVTGHLFWMELEVE
jgi:hypothetical protein